MKIIKYFFKFFLYTLLDVVYFFVYFCPKNKRKWVFGAWSGDSYSDNSKSLFEYVRDKHQSIRAIWITKNNNVFNFLKEQGCHVYKYWSWRAFFAVATSKVIILSNGRRDVSWFLTSSHFIVQLWHGIPLKKIMYDDKKNHNLNGKFRGMIEFLFPVVKVQADRVIATSQKTQLIFSKAFQMRVSSVPITGYPRNDILQKANKERTVCKFNVLYAPTFRQNHIGMLKVLPSEEELVELNALFERLGYVFWIKLHPKSWNIKLFDSKKFSNIKIFKDIDLQVLLTDTDVLITDLSSVIFDYLLTGRPIVMYMPDLSAYMQNDRELYVKYEELNIGPRLRKWDDLKKIFEKKMYNLERYKRQREKVKKYFHKYIDAKGSERVYEMIAKNVFNRE